MKLLELLNTNNMNLVTVKKYLKELQRELAHAKKTDGEYVDEISADIKKVESLIASGNITEDIAGELIQRDRGSAGKIARDLLQGAAKKLYKAGKKPTNQTIKKAAHTAANNFHSAVLKSIDDEMQGR